MLASMLESHVYFSFHPRIYPDIDSIDVQMSISMGAKPPTIQLRGELVTGACVMNLRMAAVMEMGAILMSNRRHICT
jgi:hypothetical protein